MPLTPEQKNLLAEVIGRWPLLNNGTQLECGYCRHVIIDSVIIQQSTMNAKITIHYLDCTEYTKLMKQAAQLSAARNRHN